MPSLYSAICRAVLVLAWGERLGSTNRNQECPRRSSERELADSRRDNSNVVDGWLPSLTFAFGTTGMSVPVISYVPFEELISSLQADSLGDEADHLYYLIHKVAWTTGSELIGELGQEIKKLVREHGPMLSATTHAKIEAAFDMVKRVWPGFPR
jgi:hypothetical protein